MINMYPDEPEGRMECCAVGPGGNSTLTNNDECEILEATVTSAMATRAEGMQEPGRH